MISSVWLEETTTWLTVSIILISWSVTLCVQHVQPKVTDQDLVHCPNWALFQLVISLNTCVRGWLCIVYGVEFVQLHPLNTLHVLIESSEKMHCQDRQYAQLNKSKGWFSFHGNNHVVAGGSYIIWCNTKENKVWCAAKDRVALWEQPTTREGTSFCIETDIADGKSCWDSAVRRWDQYVGFLWRRKG